MSIHAKKFLQASGTFTALISMAVLSSSPSVAFDLSGLPIVGSTLQQMITGQSRGVPTFNILDHGLNGNQIQVCLLLPCQSGPSPLVQPGINIPRPVQAPTQFPTQTTQTSQSRIVMPGTAPGMSQAGTSSIQQSLLQVPQQLLQQVPQQLLQQQLQKLSQSQQMTPSFPQQIPQQIQQQMTPSFAQQAPQPMQQPMPQQQILQQLPPR